MFALPRIVTAAGAARLGYSEARVRTELRRERWRVLASGVFLTRPDHPTRADWAHVGMILGGRDAALSGWDAARLLGLGTTWPPDQRVLVLAPHGHRNRVVGGLHLRPSARRLSTSVIAESDELLAGVRIASTARAVADTALLYEKLPHVRAMVTTAIQRNLCTAEELAVELSGGPRQRSALLRRAISDLFADVHSVAEAEAVELLRNIGITGFQANAAIIGTTGQVLYCADLLWPELRAIVEIDSREFHFTEAEWKQTMERHNALTDLGYAVKHYPPSVIRSRGVGWAWEVARWLDSRAATLSATG